MKQISAVGDWFAALDPGGVWAARGAHILLAIVLAAYAATWVGELLGAPDSAMISIIAPFVAAHTLVFTPAERRSTEILSILRLTTVAFAVFCVAYLVGWGDLGLGNAPVRITWVFAIALGFFLRGYGPTGFRLGMMLCLMFMIVAIFNPHRADAAWWVLAAIIGGASSSLIILVAWRPSPTRAFFRQLNRFLAAFVTRLDVANHPNEPTPAHGSVHAAWRRLAHTSEMAASADPKDRERLDEIVAAGLRMVLSLEVVADDPAHVFQNQPPDSPIMRALADTIGILSSGGDDPQAIAACVERLRATRDAIVAQQDRPGRERYHEARMVIGLLRTVMNFDDLIAARTQEAEAVASASPWASPLGLVATPKGRKLGLRFALQAFVAAGITTAIGLTLDLQNDYWATVTVIIVIGANVGATVRRTAQRTFGTAAGVGVAIAVLWLVGNDRTVLVVLLAVAFFPIMMVVERYYIVAAGLIGFTVVVGLHIVEALTVIQLLSRIYETVIGAIIALAAAWLLVPIRSADRVREILGGFRDQCRLALREALAGKSVRPAATKLQKDARDLSAELANIQSERLLARGIGADTRQLQAYVESLAVYISLLATILKNLATEDLPEANRMLLNELSADLDASFGTALDQHVAPVDVKDLTERWFEATKLDGSIHPRDAMWLIEVLVYGRKCLEVIGDVRSLLADHVTERTRRRA